MTTTTTLPTGTWQLDTSATTVTVTAKKLKVITVPAALTVTGGTIEIDDDHQVVDVRIEADAASYASKNPKRNAHVVSEDFLDAASHPTISFNAGSLTSTADGYRANGTVTVKGTTSPIEVAVSDVAVDDTSGSFTATATIDRTVIGVDKMPSFVIDRDLQLTVAATATRTT